MTPISRNAARDAARKTFFTGRPCKQGHIAERYVSTGNCLACLRSYSSKFRRDHAGLAIIPAQGVHPSTADEIYKVIDFYNAQHGLPPAVRPDQPSVMPTPWETYLQKQFARPRSRWPTLAWMKQDALTEWGIQEEYATMTPPSDTWTPRPAEAQATIAQLREQALQRGAALLLKAHDGYLDDEKPVDHLPKPV